MHNTTLPEHVSVSRLLSAWVYQLLRHVERMRLNLHFITVIGTLKRKNVDHLSQIQRERRRLCISWLEEYRLRGRFPQNTAHHGQVIPYFRDIYGTHCAVGYLMHRSGGDELVSEIVRSNNQVYVRELAGGAALAWISDCGDSPRKRLHGYSQPMGFFSPVVKKLVSVPPHYKKV